MGLIDKKVSIFLDTNVFQTFLGKKKTSDVLLYSPGVPNGSVFTNLKTDILKAYPTTKADAKTRAAFDSLVAPLFSGMLNLDRENARLITLRDTLLSKLMSGEIDVSKY